MRNGAHWRCSAASSPLPAHQVAGHHRCGRPSLGVAGLAAGRLAHRQRAGHALRDDRRHDRHGGVAAAATPGSRRNRSSAALALPAGPRKTVPLVKIALRAQWRQGRHVQHRPDRAPSGAAARAARAGDARACKGVPRPSGAGAGPALRAARHPCHQPGLRAGARRRRHGIAAQRSARQGHGADAARHAGPRCPKACCRKLPA